MSKKVQKASDLLAARELLGGAVGDPTSGSSSSWRCAREALREAAGAGKARPQPVG